MEYFNFYLDFTEEKQGFRHLISGINTMDLLTGLEITE